MTADRLQHRVDELFVAAVARPVAERADFLADAARDDPPEVRELVMELIAADERADSKFGARSPFNLQDFTAEDIRDPRIGQRIDDYIIRSRIASGGFGAVYHATREAPYVENVAIKLLHRENLAAPPIVQRVLREMQALSDLRHPYIVSQLHSSVTADGEPYIVMEYIHGRPLDKYCDEDQLSIDERLKLFQKICDAVQFAHEHGWVHRDLKPSNILVSDEGTPKLLDFGIAKLSAANQVDQGETLTHDLVGTPQYMSPEQLTGKTSGPATDIYALGAILYELISGHRAFDVMCSGLDAILLDAIQSAVKETIPRRPSTLVVSNELTSTGVTKEKVADQRRSSPSGLKRCLEGDIDNIVMMALRKEPTRRYATAAAVAEDIQRWLDHRPVMACADSMAYRTNKFVRRNRRALMIGMVVVLCISVALVTWKNGYRASATRDTERAQRFIESAQQFIDDDSITQAIVLFHAAHHAAPTGSEMHGAASRMLAGWGRYLGIPLGTQANIRYAFNQDGQRLSVSRSDGVTTIWDTSRMRKLGSCQTGGPVVCQTFSPDSKSLLTVTQQGQARCWDVATGERRCEQEIGGTVVSARLEEDRALFLKVSPEKVRLWQWIFNGSIVRELAARKVSAELMDTEFVNNRMLVVAQKSGDMRQVEIWDAQSLELKRTITGSASALGPRELGANDTLIAQSYRDGTGERTAVLDLTHFHPLGVFPGKVLDVHNTGTHFLIKDDRRLRLCGLTPNLEIIKAWKKQFAGRWDAAFGVDEKILVAEVRTTPRPHTVVTSDGLEAGAEAPPQRFPHPFFSQWAHDFDRAEFGPQGRFVVFDNRHDGATANTRVPWLWSVEPFLAEAASLQLGSQPRSLRIEGDLVVAATKNALQCWTTSTGQQRHIALPNVTALAIGGRNQLAVAGDASGTIHFLELPKLRLIKTLPHAPKQAIRSISLNSDGTTILVTTQEEACLLADKLPLTANSMPSRVATSKREKSAFDKARLSANGSTFAVASHVAVRCCDASNGLERRLPIKLKNVPGRVGDFVFTDESSLVATIHHGAVYLLGRNGLLKRMGNRANSECVALRPDGKVLAMGHSDGTLQFWDTVTRRRLSRKLRAGSAAICCLAFSNDGRRLASATESGTIRVWATAFEFPYHEQHLRATLEVLTGHDLEPSRSDAPRHLDKVEWCNRYRHLEANDVFAAESWILSR